MSKPYTDEKSSPVPGGYAITSVTKQGHYGGGEHISMQPQAGGYPAPQQYPPPQQGYYQPGQPPITNQPGSWMAAPQGLPDCPRGLEYLASIDQLLVHQKVELLEALIGFETNNKFTIKNSLGQKVYWAVEDNDCCTRNCCGPIRPFEMKILDSFQNEVIHLNRPLACDSCCCPCCLQSIEVSSPPGNIIGTVEQNWSLCYPDLSIKDASGEVILKIDGPLCKFAMCSDVEFKISTLDGTQVGKISKQWSGLSRELFTDADHFGITFPLDLDCKLKAVCLGAVFLIDMMYFETQGNN